MTSVSTGVERSVLLDVSRLVWRVWRQGLPTGVDRVCLAYLDFFGSRSQAVVQRGGFQFVLSAGHSDRLFALLRKGRSARRRDLISHAILALPSALLSTPRPGMTYINVGHTGLNESSLPAWIARHRLRAIYLVHDLIPLSHPQYCRPGEAIKHRARMANVLESASGVIGNSRATLDELAAFAGVSGVEMPPSVAALIGGYRAPSAVHPHELPKPYFIVVGTIEGRKNHLLLLRVWQRLVAELGPSAPTLVIIGQRGWQAGSALDLLDNLDELEGHVLELGKCADSQLAAWTTGARALLMPSFVEGFGLPIIEALQLSTPVIASDLPVYREIAGEIPEYLDPLDEPAWERAIRECMTGTGTWARQVAEMKDYRAPDWPTHFSIVEKWLKGLCH